ATDSPSAASITALGLRLSSVMLMLALASMVSIIVSKLGAKYGTRLCCVQERYRTTTAHHYMHVIAHNRIGIHAHGKDPGKAPASAVQPTCFHVHGRSCCSDQRRSARPAASTARCRDRTGTSGPQESRGRWSCRQPD